MRFRDSFQRSIFIIQATALILLYSCAVQVSPSGGPKDETPPEILKSKPANNSVNFADDRITLTFDEFVTLKDINTQLVISPPLNETPEFIMRGKNMIMKFNEPLLENATYSFFFGDAIVDITEANPISAYNFSFSTGPVLDSLSIKGKLLDAFTNKPVESAYVMLYDTIYDSVPYLRRPYYLSKTNKEGAFALNNLRDSKYLMFALSDINSNYLYDLPTENIAFADSLIRPLFHGSAIKLAAQTDQSLPDSLSQSDSLKAQLYFMTTDSLKIDLSDSLAINQAIDSLKITDSLVSRPKLPAYTLYQFREADTTQQLLKGSVVRNNVISLIFRQPTKAFTFKPLEPIYENEWSITSFNRSLDTVNIWVQHPLSDSLTVEVADNGVILDTLYLALVAQAKPVRGKPAIAKPKVLEMRSNVKGSKIRPDNDLIITFEDPIASFKPEKILLFADTIQISPTIAFRDSIQLKVHIKYPWKESIRYRVEVPDSTFISIFGYANDSNTYKFTRLTEAETGLVNLTVNPATEDQYIIQLLDDKEVIIREDIITGKKVLKYDYLSVRKYIFKAILDSNRNGKWDTGNYLQKRQPEKVFYYFKELEIKANWTVEEEWKIE